MNHTLDVATRQFLQTLFPFHVVIDQHGVVIDVGPSLGGVARHARGKLFLEVFEPVRPAFAAHGDVPAAVGQVALLGIRGSAAQLRGQYVEVGGGAHAFVGSPRIVDAESRTAWPIGISDFAPHDGTADYAMVLEAVQLQLAELERLATQLNEAVRVQREFREKAEEASRSKSHFLANVSHEIRTPMTVIMGYSDLLRDPSLPEPERREYLETLRRSGDHLLALLSDILDFSRLESGQFRVARDEMSVVDAVEDAANSLQVRARTAGVELSWSGACEETRSLVLCDSIRVRQVTLNLISNAIKFTPRGTVHVHVAAQPWDGAQEFRIEVRDTGCGIPESLIPSLFEPFRQMESRFFRESGGAGLGLAICSRIAHALDGRIEVSSEVGRGSRFTLFFRAPLARTVAPEAAAGLPDVVARTKARTTSTGGPSRHEAIRLGGRRVLLVEDSPDTQRLYAHWIGVAGGSVKSVGDGIAAVDFIAASAAGQEPPPHVILMDMQLPGIDGIEATIRIRALGFKSTIIGISATGQKFVQDRALAAGCDDYRIKPIVRAELLELFRESC
ncbi:MAG: ATP-binding protein [Planctomycetota bacterium]|nr:ATP-binding protein [Planctomycetota bacterium]